MTVIFTGNDSDGIVVNLPNSTYITRPGEFVTNTGTAVSLGAFVGVVYNNFGYVISSSGLGVSMASNADLFVGEDGFVQGTSGVSSSSTGTVLNQGQITGTDFEGLSLVSRASAINEGSIFGAQSGVSLTSSNGGHFTNHGVVSSAFVGLVATGTEKTVVNTGTISGNGAVDSNVIDFQMVNTGTISGDSLVLNFFGSNAESVIVNSGLIEARDPGGNAIQGSTSIEDVTNEGVIRGDIDLSAGQDIYTSMNGQLFGRLELGSGDDTLILGAGTLQNLFVANGESGADSFEIKDAPYAIWVDLEFGTDEDGSFGEVWTRDARDLASGTWRKLAELVEIEDITGTSGRDMIFGDFRDNTFTYVENSFADGVETHDGRGGTDLLDMSGASTAVWIDLVNGGAWTQGDVDATDDPTVENPWEQLSTTLNIEDLRGTQFVDFMAGNEADNTFFYDGQDDAPGIEVMNGRLGSDTADFSSFDSAIWVELSFAGTEVWTQDELNISLLGSGWREIADLTSVENVVGTDQGDFLQGNAEANILTGGLGDDILTGRGGFDTFVFVADNTFDVITDFDSNDAEKIDVSQVADITDFMDIQLDATQDYSGNLIINNQSGTMSISLAGYSLADLGNAIDAGDFIFQ